MKLAIESLSPFRESQIAPKAFLNKLKKSLKINKLCSFSTRYLPFYDIGLYATTNKSIFNKPFVLRLDGIYIDKFNTIKNSDNENKKIFNSIEKSAGVIFNSQYSKSVVEKFYKKIEKPNIIIPNGVDRSLFNPEGVNLRHEFNIKNEEIVLITCAQWRRHKRLKETIKFFKKIQNERSENFKLIVIGPDNNHEKEKDVIFSGYIKNEHLAKWYRTADYYIHLSWIEANSNSQCEAISCGLPVLCSNNGGNYESVIDLDVGVVSKCDKPYDFTKIDLYNPPEPDYHILLKDFNLLIEKKFNFCKNSKIQKIDIHNVAKQYFDFIERVYKKK